QHATAAFPEQRSVKKGRGRVVAGIAVAAAVLVTGSIAAWATLRDSGPPQLPVLYQEDFTQTSGGWDGTYDPTDAVSYGYRTDGTYGLDVEADDVEHLVKAPAPFLVATPTATPSPSSTPTPMLPQTVVVGVTAQVKRTVGTGEYGVYCHNANDGTYYEFALDTSGMARIRRIFNGSGGTLAQPVQVDGVGSKAVRIEASCEQNGTTVRLTMWVNGEQIHQVDDPNGIGNGYVGLFTRTSKAERSVLKTTFDDFELRGRKEP
ncbi:MAG TPA: serine/threonine protein kinase, partial [Nonomuraea sp.]|nr:serine/threonine protein kinase [Nonomuraea sp.]